METLQNTILIIEDDLGTNELICDKMTECGYQTHAALSALEANNWLSANSPILMVVDYNLNDIHDKQRSANGRNENGNKQTIDKYGSRKTLSLIEFYFQAKITKSILP